jgi:hypothetical protein
MQNSGNLTLTGFKYTPDDGKPMNINKAAVQFTNTRINLQELDLTTGKTDMKVNGVLENFLGLCSKPGTQGNFNMMSNQFAVADFMSPEKPATATEKPKEAVKVPAFLNCSLTAKANTVLYDNLNMKNVSGKITIRGPESNAAKR